MRLGPALVAFLIGVAGFSTMVASHRLEHVRSVDTVQLIATGMCFGIAIVLAARSRKTG